MCFLRHLNRRFVLQHGPDNQRTQQVKYCQNCEQRAEADGVSQCTDNQRKQRTCQLCGHPG